MVVLSDYLFIFADGSENILKRKIIMSPKFKEYGDDFKIKFIRHTGKRLDD